MELLDSVNFLSAHPVEDQFGHTPRPLVGGDIRAVLVETTVQELEGITGLVHLVEGIDEVLTGDILGEEVKQENGLGPCGAARFETRVAQVVQHGTSPGKAFDQTLLVKTGFLKERTRLLEQGVAKLDGEEHLDTEAFLLEELVVKERPDDRLHAVGLPVDQCGLVDAVDEDEDALVSEGLQDALETVNVLISTVFGVIEVERPPCRMREFGQRGGIGKLGFWEASILFEEFFS